MDIRKVKKLIELLEESGIAEIEIHEGEESVRISRDGSIPLPQTTANVPPVDEGSPLKNNRVLTKIYQMMITVMRVRLLLPQW